VRKRVTIQEVAREAGTSITTVSRYLNGRYENMSQETKEKIKKIIEMLDYQPNTLAQGLKGNRSRIVAAVVVNIGYPYCVSLIRAIQDVLTPAGYSLAVCETGGDAERELRVLQSLQAQQVDGLILQTNGDNNEELHKIASRTPVVLVDRTFSIPRVASVVTDNEVASNTLTTHLLQQGYKNVMYVTEEVGQISTRDQRLNGYIAACCARGVEPWICWVNRAHPDTFSHAIDALETKKDARPYAVYTANGLLMKEIYEALIDEGMHIPNLLGIATFDEPDWVNLIRPTLTCIRQPTQETGEWAANEILRRMAVDFVPPVVEVQVLKSTLVYGDSTRLS
jgi:LacI family transcriptional regulator, kdg operon repressor